MRKIIIVIISIIITISISISFLIASLIESPYINSYHAVTHIILLEITAPFNNGYIRCESNYPKFLLKTKDERKFVSDYFDEYSENEIKGIARRGDTYYKYKFAPFTSRYSIALLEELPPDHHPEIPQ